FARRLAGDRGTSIVRELPHGRAITWSLVTRTYSFDQMIANAIAHDGADMVLNLAAGLDTRAYRMQLPKELRWIDVDLTDILKYRTDKLAGETPACELETVALDLADEEARRALFARLGAVAKNVLVVSEGLLTYWTEAQVAALADDLHASATFRTWLFDLLS